MKDESLDRVLHAIRIAADDAGFLAANVDQFCDATGFSRATIRRALSDLVAIGEIIAEPKRGPGGGYRIQLKKCSEKCSEAEHNLSTIREHTMPFENSAQADLRSASEPELNSLDSDAEHNSAQWVRGPAFGPPELPADVRKRGAQFFREVRLSLLPKKPKDPNARIVNELEPPLK